MIILKKDVHKRCRENQNINFILDKKNFFLEDNIKKIYSKAGQATGGSIAHARCMMDT
jgi:hypothetical protein